MMIEPGMDTLMQIVDNRYSLVVAVAKRARELSDEGVHPMVDVASEYEKTVSTAVKETAKGYINIIPADDEEMVTEDAVYTEYIEESDEDEE